MVEVGCRGRGALRRGLLGSVSTGVIHHAHCPVSVIHDKVPSSMQPVGGGVDGSPASELATAIAFDEASWRGVDLVALHTWSDGGVPRSEPGMVGSTSRRRGAPGGAHHRLARTLPRRQRWWFGISLNGANGSV